jgi:GNAT superfamily N-acetyltransferase
VDELPVYEVRDGAYLISTDVALIDLDAVERFLRASYWAAERTRAQIARSLRSSVAFGLYEDGRQVGFARVVTDATDFAWLCDVFVEPELRGKDLGKWLIASVLAHPELQGLRRWILATRDAHGLYAQSGFAPLADPRRWMERTGPQNG